MVKCACELLFYYIYYSGFVCWFVFVQLDELVNCEGITQSVKTGVGEVSGGKGTGEQEAWFVCQEGDRLGGRHRHDSEETQDLEQSLSHQMGGPPEGWPCPTEHTQCPY